MNKLMDTIDVPSMVGIAGNVQPLLRAVWLLKGMQPFCSIYSSFMQRAYDNVIHDIALLRPVVLCLDAPDW